MALVRAQLFAQCFWRAMSAVVAVQTNVLGQYPRFFYMMNTLCNCLFPPPSLFQGKEDGRNKMGETKAAGEKGAFFFFLAWLH
jgi:hypothetical protein